MTDTNTISTGPMADFIKSMSIDKDIMSCFSYKTLITIIEKLEQLTIIIDFKGIQPQEIDMLRKSKHKNNHLILLVITADDYHFVKEIGSYDWFDDFVLKPVNGKDLDTRMLIMQNRVNRASIMEKSGKTTSRAMVNLYEDNNPVYNGYEYRKAAGNGKEKDFVEEYYDFDQDKRKEFGYFIDTNPIKDVFKDQQE